MSLSYWFYFALEWWTVHVPSALNDTPGSFRPFRQDLKSNPHRGIKDPDTIWTIQLDHAKNYKWDLNRFQKFFTLSNFQNTQDFKKFFKLSRFSELSIPQDLCTTSIFTFNQVCQVLGKSQFSSQNFTTLFMHFVYRIFLISISSSRLFITKNSLKWVYRCVIFACLLSDDSSEFYGFPQLSWADCWVVLRSLSHFQIPWKFTDINHKVFGYWENDFL